MLAFPIQEILYALKVESKRMVKECKISPTPMDLLSQNKSHLFLYKHLVIWNINAGSPKDVWGKFIHVRHFEFHELKT